MSLALALGGVLVNITVDLPKSVD